jgi:nitric oxide reductase NorD protein
MTENSLDSLGELPHALSERHRSELQAVIRLLSSATVERWKLSGTLQEWLEQSLTVAAGRGGRRDELQHKFIVAIPAILSHLEGNEIADWIRAAADIESEYPHVFLSLPEELRTLDLIDRNNVYKLVRTAAFRSPQSAALLYQNLPVTLAQMSPDIRGLLVRCLQTAALFDPTPLPAVLPLIGPTFRVLPHASHYPLLDRIVKLAQTLPAAVARLFRTLTRAYDAVGEEGIVAWILTGEEIAKKNAQAGEAFFALESRTSQLFLSGSSVHVALSDIYSFLLKYLHMMSGASVELKEDQLIAIPPPLADFDGECVPLPPSIDVFATHEENLRLYRALAAQHAGRLAFGTYDCSIARLWTLLPTVAQEALASDGTIPADLFAFFDRFPQPEQIETLFLLLESERISANLVGTYPGLRTELEWLKLQENLATPTVAFLLRQIPSGVLPQLPAGASVYDSLLLATEVYSSITLSQGFRRERSFEDDFPPPKDSPPDQQMATKDDHGAGVMVDSAHLSAQQRETWRRLVEALRERKGKGGKQQRTIKGSTITLVGDSSGEAERADDADRHKHSRARRGAGVAEFGYLYDEWDFLIDDYRPQWCELRERAISGDDGGFFSRTLATHAELTAEIKREFQRLRPRQYHHVNGLEHGEDIDVNAAVAARVDRRSGLAPSQKLYTARLPLARDVAALFLLDLSASTEGGVGDGEGRVIDRMKEALVLLTTALEEIGDVYSVYGFSSYGRRNVEVYPVKSFNESLSESVKARIGGLEPQRSTRMGPAVRHATRRLRDLSCRAKFLVLLSDGYPEDADYGPSHATPTYGVRDTMMALREAERSGVLSFCLTIDKTGRDYLREMCSPSRYMIIEDVRSLPAELPKIYQRYIRVQSG